MTKQFAPGDLIYSQHGNQAEFVARSDGAYIVRPYYEDDDGPQTGDIETWNVAFRTPPAPKLDAETAAAEKRLSEITAAVNELHTQKYELEKDSKARLERIKLHTELADLDRYLAGEITHYVAVHEYSPEVEIIPVGETVEGYNNGQNYGMLQLYPSRAWDKTIRWSVTYRTENRYEYSKTKQVFPCCGEDAAKAKAAEIVQAMVTAYLEKEPKFRHYPDALVKACARFGVECPKGILDGIAEVKRNQLTASIAEHKKKLTDAENELAAI